MSDDIDAHLNELLGIDMSNPVQRLACELTDGQYDMLRQLRVIREQRGLSRADVAERMGATEKGVALLESAMADPKMSTIRRYALAVGASIHHRVYRYCLDPDCDGCGL